MMGGGGPACRLCGADALHSTGSVAGYDFLECLHCGFIFAPAITAAAVAPLYADAARGPSQGAPSGGWADPGFLVPALERLPGGRPLRILDFGAGDSLVPEWLRGHGHRVIATDLAPPARPHPDRLTGPLQALDLPLRSFDLVYTFQVVEHLPEPRPVLDHLLRLVRPGGLLLVHTDMEVPERAVGFRRWWYVMPPDHCTFYRHRSFEVLLANTPHRLDWCDPKTVLIRAGRDSRPI